MGIVYEAHDPELERTVAIKLVRPAAAADDDDDAPARLLREAQAMALLQHPNVVPVYDAGRSGGHVYLVMERLTGDSLRRWLERQRPWQEIVAVFAAAGRGLAAAHAAGIVHRDFKPANVVVGEDGGVFVLDFGLAHAASRDSPSRSRSRDPPTTFRARGVDAEDSTGTDRLSARLTRVGLVMGTPRFMAPEQHEDGDVDPRTDQYSLCVALYQALFGVAPYTGGSTAELLQAKLAERRQAPVRGSDVPRSLRRAIERGLAADPGARHPSMARLLDALEPRASRWRAMAIGGGALALAAAAVIVEPVEPDPDACTDVPTVEQLWSGARRDEAERAIAGAQRGYAADTWTRVDAAMGQWARSWVAAQTEACADASEGADVVRWCLADRRGAFGEAAAVLAEVDADALGRVVRVVTSLPAPAGCETASDEASWATLPADPELRSAIGRARARLARASALEKMGRWDDSILVGREALAAAQATGFAPAIAEVEYQLGMSLCFGQQCEEGERLLVEAVHKAEAVGHASVVVSAASGLTFITGSMDNRYDEAIRWARLGQAHLERVADDGNREANLLDALGAVYSSRGEPAQAEPLHRQAIALHVSAHEEQSDETDEADEDRRERSIGLATSRNNLGIALYSLGRFEEAIEQYEQVVKLREVALGEHHPDVGAAYNNLANALMQIRRLDEARDEHVRSMAIWEAGLGRKHPFIGASLNNLGNVEYNLGDFEAAEARYREALALRLEVLPPDHVDLAATRLNLGAVLTERKAYVEAQAIIMQANEVFETVLGEDHPYAVSSRGSLAELRRLQGDLDGAIAQQRAVVQTQQRVLPADHPELGAAYVSLGNMLDEAGDADGARQELERAVAVYEKGSPDPLELARARFELAKLEVSVDPGRARARADAAAATMADHEEAADERADVEAWLAAQLDRR